MAASEPVSDEIVDTLVLPLVERAVPEWQASPAVLLALPEISGPVGYSGGVISIGIRLAVVEPRIAAAVLFAGSFVPRSMFAEARQVTIPLHTLLQWDDEGNARQTALDLFDAFGSTEKHCTPIWAGTRASHSSPGRTPTGSSPGTSSEAHHLGDRGSDLTAGAATLIHRVGP